MSTTDTGDLIFFQDGLISLEFYKESQRSGVTPVRLATILFSGFSPRGANALGRFRPLQSPVTFPTSIRSFCAIALLCLPLFTSYLLSQTDTYDFIPVGTTASSPHLRPDSPARWPSR